MLPLQPCAQPPIPYEDYSCMRKDFDRWRICSEYVLPHHGRPYRPTVLHAQVPKERRSFLFTGLVIPILLQITLRYLASCWRTPEIPSCTVNVQQLPAQDMDPLTLGGKTE